MKKSLILILGLFFISFISAFPQTININLQATDSGGTIQPGTYLYNFMISQYSNCSDPVYLNNQTITTDSRAIAAVQITPNISFNLIDYYLCVYRDNVLKSNQSFSSIPYAFFSLSSNYSFYSNYSLFSNYSYFSGNADTVDNYHASAFGKLNEDNYWNGINRFEINSTSTSSQFRTILRQEGVTTKYIKYIAAREEFWDTIYNDLVEQYDTYKVSEFRILNDTKEIGFEDEGYGYSFLMQLPMNITNDLRVTGNIYGNGSLLTGVCLANGTNCLPQSTYNSTYNNLLGYSCPSGQVVNGTYTNGSLKCQTVSSGTTITGGLNGSFAYNSSGTAKYTPYSFYNETSGITTFSATSGSLVPGQTVLDVKGKIRMGYTAGLAENSAIQLLHGWGAMNRTSNQLMRFDGSINTGGVATTETYRIMQFEMGSITVPVGNTGGQANVYEASSWLTGIPAGATFGTINWFRSSPAYVSAGTVGLSNGFYSAPVLYSSGNVTTSNGAYILNPTYYSTGKVFYNHGINMPEHTAGTVRNIGYLYGTAPASGNYTFYSSSKQESYLAGNITTFGYKNSTGSAGIGGTYNYMNTTGGNCSMTFSQGLLMSATGCS